MDLVETGLGHGIHERDIEAESRMIRALEEIGKIVDPAVEPVTCYLCGQDVAACLIAEKCEPIEVPLLYQSMTGQWRVPRAISSTVMITRRVALQFSQFVDPGANARIKRKRK